MPGVSERMVGRVAVLVSLAEAGQGHISDSGLAPSSRALWLAKSSRPKAEPLLRLASALNAPAGRGKVEKAVVYPEGRGVPDTTALTAGSLAET